jgi:CheY-like chemotaxis protein
MHRPSFDAGGGRSYSQIDKSVSETTLSPGMKDFNLKGGAIDIAAANPHQSPASERTVAGSIQPPELEGDIQDLSRPKAFDSCGASGTMSSLVENTKSKGGTQSGNGSTTGELRSEAEIKLLKNNEEFGLSEPPSNFACDSPISKGESIPEDAKAFDIATSQKRAAFNPHLSSEYPLNILIAEESIINSHLAFGSLKKLGYTSQNITVVFDGLAAINHYETSLSLPPTQRYSIVFMDPLMSNMDGYEATTKIIDVAKAHGEATKIIAVIADMTSDSVDRAKAAGVHGILVKPYKVLDIEQLIIDNFHTRGCHQSETVDKDMSSSTSSDFHSSESEQTGSDNTTDELCSHLKDVRVGGELTMTPILDPARRAMVDRIMAQFWAIFKQQWPSNVRQHTRTSYQESETAGSTPLKQRTAQSRSFQRKRQRKDEGEDSDRGDDRIRQPPSQSTPPANGPTERPKFACMFRKHDPCRYSIYSHRSCALSHWPSIARVKYRTHYRHSLSY